MKKTNMPNNAFILEMNDGGELLRRDIHSTTLNKHKPDSPFLSTPVSFLLMVMCVVIDVAFFRSLFVQISYDTPFMIWLETLGLAFAADIIPAFAGILAKNIAQGLRRDKFNLGLLLCVPSAALLVNASLRTVTVSLNSATGVADAESIALAIISIVMPILTSLGNFGISYQTFDPLSNRLMREELALEELDDTLRRLEALLSEADSFNENELLELDHEHLFVAKQQVINDALERVNHAGLTLAEHLQDPTSTNVVGKTQVNDIIQQLTTELNAIGSACAGRFPFLTDSSTAAVSFPRDASTTKTAV